MKSPRGSRFFLYFVASLLWTTSLLAAPAELRVLLDADNNASTGCRVITALGNVQGVDAIFTTTYANGADGKPVVTGITKALCAQQGTVNFTAPEQIDAGGWGVGTDGSGNNVAVETRIPTSALPSALHPNMRWYFVGVSDTNVELVVQDQNGKAILFPAPPVSHPRIVGPKGARDIQMDGKFDDWTGIPALVSGLAVTGGGKFRFLGGITAWSTAQNVFFNFSIQSNSNAPQANDDGYTVLRGKTINISTPGVLANDLDPHNKPLTANLISGPEHGTLNLNPNGGFSYTNDGSNAPNDGFRYKANNGSADSNTAKVVFDIVDNRPPNAVDDSYNVTHGGTLNVPAPGVLTNDNDPDGDPLLPQVAVPPAHGTVVLNNDGSFTYTHDGSNTTSDQFGYHDFDPFTVSNVATVVLTVGPDLPPVAVNDSGYTVAEGGTLTVTGLPNAQSLFNNDTDPDSPKSLFSATVSQNPAHGTVTITAGGGFTYVHDGSETTTDTFKYKLSDGILNAPVDATVTITITPVDDAPVNTVPGGQTLLEDGTLTFSSGNGNAISIADVDAGAGNMTITLAATNGTLTLGSTAGLSVTGNGTSSVQATGTLAAINTGLNGTVFTPTANYNGAATVTLTTNDNGNTGAGGPKSAISTINLTITPVNDVPSFNAGGPVTVLEDSAPYSAPWATAISAGPADEAGQTLTFQVTNNTNPSLFSAGPAVSPTGVLTFTLAPNANGSATITFALKDNGGTANGGVDTSAGQFLTINVTAVNDAPSFTKGADENVSEDSGAHNVPGWATAISAGPADESGQTLTFLVSNNNNALFSVQPGVSPTGTLTYTLNPNAFGTAIVTISLQDSGGVANGGVDTSASQQFNIVVAGVNDPPVITRPATVSTNEDTPFIFNGGNTISVADPDAAAGSLSLTLGVSNGTLTLSGTTGLVVSGNGTNSVTASGTLANLNAALNGLSYSPTLNFNGSDTLNIGINDNGNTGSGGALTDSKSTTITVNPVNDAPVLVAGHTVGYTENAAAVTLEPALTITDVDSPNMQGAVVSIGTNFASGQDVLSFTPVGAVTGIYNPGTGTLTLSGTDTLANYQTALRSVTYANTSDNPSTLQRGINWSVTDSSAATSASNASTTTAVNITAVNDAPVVTAGGTLNYTEDQAATAIEPTLTVTDVDSTNLVGATIQITANLASSEDALAFTPVGSITGIYNSATGKLTLSGTDTVANYQTALRSVTYFNNSNNPSAAARTVSWQVDDGAAANNLSNIATSTVNVTPTPDAPVVTAGGTVGFTENGSAVVIASGLTVTDFDSTQLQGATVQITGNLASGEDVLACPACGGTITASYSAATGKLTLSGTDTLANYQAALRSVTYANTSDNPSTLQRTVTFIGTDTTALSSAGSTSQVNVTAVNDAPVITRPATISTNEDTTFTFNGGNTISIADADAQAGSETVTVSVTNGVLTLSGTAGLTVSGNGTNSITASGTLANLNAALNGMTYLPGTDYNGSDTLNIGVNDNGNTGTGGAQADSKTTAITVNAVNDAPVAVADAYSVNEDNPLTVNAASGVLANDTDVDTPHASLTAVLNVGPTNASSFTLNADGSFNYTPNSNFAGSDSFTYHAFDGALSSNIVTVTITVNAVNDAPSITRPATISTNEDTTFTFNGGNVISIADVDAGAGSETVTLSVANGVLTLSGTTGLTVSGNGTSSITASGTLTNLNNALNGMTYLPSLNYNGSDTLSIGVNDNGNTGTGGAQTDSKTTAITVNPVNDAPVAVADGYSVNEDTPLTVNAASGVLANDTDVDTPHASLTAVLNVGPTNASSFTLNADGSFNYTPNSNFNGSDQFTYHAFDGALSSNIVTVTITVNAVNDAPVNSMPAPPTMNQDSTYTFTPVANAIQISDVDAGANPVQVALTSTNGTMTLSGTAGLSFSVGDGTADTAMTFTGTIAAINTALNGMQFTSNPGFFGTATIQIVTNDQGNSGSGGALSDTDSLNITVLQVNQAPVNSVPGTQTINEDTALTFSSGNGNAVTISDPDAGANPVKVTLTVTNGTLTLGGIAGLSFSVGDGTSDATMTFTGTMTAINTAMNGMVYSPTLNYNGSATFTILTDDQGNTGPGGAKTDTDSVTININPVDDAPVANPDNYSVNEGGTLTISIAALPTRPVAGNAVDNAARSGGKRRAVNPPAGQPGNGGIIVADVTTGVLNNDTDIDTPHGSLTAILVSGPAHASTFTLNSDGTFTYIHDGSETTTDSFTYKANDGTLDSNVTTATITVNPVNDAPVNSVPGTQTINEDTTLTFSSGNGNAVTISDADAGAASVQVQLTVTNGTLTLGGITGLAFTVGDGTADATMTFTGTMTAINTAMNGMVYTPAANFNGGASLTITTNDQGNTGSGGAQSDTDAVTINVTAVNDAPVITRPATVTANEDTAFPFSGGNVISIADVDAGGGSLTVTLGVTNGTLNLSGTTGLTVSGNGTNSITASGTLANLNAALNGMTYTGNSDFNGSDTLNIGVNDNGNTGTGGALTDSKSTSITVTAVNDAPVNTVPGTQTFNEDTTLTFSTGNGNAISIADVDAGSSNLTVTLTTTAGTMAFGSVAGLSGVTNNAATIVATGTLTNLNNALQGLVFTPTLNINGAQTIQLTTNDNGNTGSGGAQSDVDTINLSITAVNDAPTLTNPASFSVNEDTAFTFTGGNAITAADVDIASGTMNLTMTATNGTIHLTTGGGAIINNNDTGNVTASGTLAQINAALNNSTFTGSANFYDTVGNTETITVNVNDNGNTGTGGSLQANASITVTINPVNDPPTAVSYCASGCTNGRLPAQAGIKISFPAGKLGGSDETREATVSGTTVTLNTTPNTTCTGCTVTINADGSFDFTPPPSAAGTVVSFTYHVADNGFPGPGVNSTPATVEFNVAGPAIYFVKSAAVGAADCKLGSECLFTTAVGQIGASTNAVIFMEDANSHTPGAVALNSGGMVIGQGITGFANFDTLFGINASPGSGGTLAARPAISAARPTLTNSPLTLNASSQARGFNINTNTGSGLIAAARNNVVVSDMNITSSVNSAAQFCVNFTGPSTGGTYTFGTITVTAGNAGSGINWNNVQSASTVTFGAISMGGAGNAATFVNTGATNFTLGDISASTGTGFSSTTSSGNFTLNNVTTTTGAAFSASSSGAGTFSVNDVTSTTGTAVNVATATGSFTFHSVTANGAVDGVTVSALTGAGSFTINGTGTTANTGGTIQNCTHNGLKFSNANNVTLKNMNLNNNGTAQTVAGAASTCGGDLLTGNNLSCVANINLLTATTVSIDRTSITNSGQMGINGNSVNGLSITNCTITGNGDESSENGVLLQNTSGTLTVNNNTIRDNEARQMYVANIGAQVLTFNTTSTSYSRTVDGTASAGQGLFMDLQGTSSTTFTGTSLTFSHAQGVTQQNALQINVNGSATMPTSSISNSSFDLQAAAIDITSGSNGNATFNAINNTIDRSSVQSILYGFLGAAGNGTLTGTIQSNKIGQTQGCITAAAACAGISINSGNGWFGQMHLLVDSNTIQRVSGGLLVTIDGSAGATPTAHIKMTKNTINTPTGGAADAALRITAATTSGNPNLNGCWDVGGAALQNVIAGDWGVGGATTSIQFRQRFTGNGSWILPGYGGAAGDSAAVTTYVDGRNTITPPSGGFTKVLVTNTTTPFANGSCVTP